MRNASYGDGTTLCFRFVIHWTDGDDEYTGVVGLSRYTAYPTNKTDYKLFRHACLSINHIRTLTIQSYNQIYILHYGFRLTELFVEHSKLRVHRIYLFSKFVNKGVSPSLLFWIMNFNVNSQITILETPERLNIFLFIFQKGKASTIRILIAIKLKYTLLVREYNIIRILNRITRLRLGDFVQIIEYYFLTVIL